MKSYVVMLGLMLIVTIATGCGKQQGSEDIETGGDDHLIVISLEEKKMSYTSISQEEAKRMMEVDDGHVIVDVRRQSEYDEGHIPGAICIPNESIFDEKPEELPDLNQIILVYCRSGRRSKEAAQKLYDIGYTNVFEFGGINDWTGEVVKMEWKLDMDTFGPAVQKRS